jgi:hypothetical protein
MDPRVKISTADLEKQLALEMKLASAISESSGAVFEARSVREQLAKIESADSSWKETVSKLDSRVSELLEGERKTNRPGLTGVNQALTTLYKAIEQADAAPTVAQAGAFQKTEAQLTPLLAQWNQLTKSEIPSLNQQLKDKGKQPLQLDLPPSEQAVSEDQE